jgi:ribose transport system substrate-binding protein
MEILFKLKKGEKVEPVTIAGLDVVTKENVDKFLAGTK